MILDNPIFALSADTWRFLETVPLAELLTSQANFDTPAGVEMGGLLKYMCAEEERFLLSQGKPVSRIEVIYTPEGETSCFPQNTVGVRLFTADGGVCGGFLTMPEDDDDKESIERPDPNQWAMN